MCLGSVLAGAIIHAFVEREFLHFDLIITRLITATALAVAVLFSCRKRFGVVCTILLCIGFVHYDAALLSLPTVLPRDGARLSGVVIDEPYRGLGFSAVTVGVGDRGAHIRIQAKFPIEAAFGDRISWSCAPERVVPEGRFSYADWLFVRGVGWTCMINTPPVVEAHGDSGILGAIYGIKGSFRDAVQRLYPEPESSFLLGLLIGDRQGLPKEMKDAFRETGTTHILAVSGYNVTQLTRVGLVLFAIAGILRQRAAVLVVGLVIGFVLLVGADASVVRAGIMGSLGLFAVIARRRYSGTNAVLAAATMMVMVNPFVLRHDVGFLLSFTAVLGLQVLAVPFAEACTFLPDAMTIRRTFAETLAAIVMTFPLILYAFGSFPPTALPVNVVVLPLIPAAMSIGIVSVLFGTVSVSLGMGIALIGTAIMRIVQKVIGVSAGALPSLTVDASLIALIVSYSSIALLWYALTRRQARRQRLAGSITTEAHDVA